MYCKASKLKVVFIQKEGTEANSVEDHKTVKFAVIKVRAANIRSGPSTEFGILGVAKEGDAFEIVSISNDWYEIKYKGQSGYVHSKLVYKP